MSNTLDAKCSCSPTFKLVWSGWWTEWSWGREWPCPDLALSPPFCPLFTVFIMLSGSHAHAHTHTDSQKTLLTCSLNCDPPSKVWVELKSDVSGTGMSQTNRLAAYFPCINYHELKAKLISNGVVRACVCVTLCDRKWEQPERDERIQPDSSN